MPLRTLLTGLDIKGTLVSLVCGSADFLKIRGKIPPIFKDSSKNR